MQILECSRCVAENGTRRPLPPLIVCNLRSFSMQLTIAHITPLAALIAGILILIVPRLLNYVVAIYLILVGLTGLNAINHFIH
jgi:Protein of unknown function (DUF3096)